MSQALYLEIDEDITSAIDKMAKAAENEVAIVVPKRSTLLQSLVNLKLLKKSADDLGKRLVLVTSDKTAVHLAGRVGIPVAATLHADAHVPEPDVEEPAEATEIAEEEAPAAARAKEKSKPEPTMVVKPIEDEPLEHVIDREQPAAVAHGAKTKKVPDFNALQKRLVWAGLLVFIIILFFGFNFFFAKAKVTLYANADQIPVALDFNVDPTAISSDFAASKLHGKLLSEDKSLTSTFSATGQKDVGTKASGTITVTNYCFNPPTIPASTAFTASGKVFRNTDPVDLPTANFVAGNCMATHKDVNVVADQNGDSYNLAPTTYTVDSYPSSGTVYVRGQGDQMSGGTSKIQTVVAQSDVDTAKQALLDKNHDAIKKELEGKADSTDRAIAESFNVNVTNVSVSPAVGDQADQATLTLAVTYAELTVSKADFDKLLETQEQKQVGAKNQIYDDGNQAAKIATIDQRTASGAQSFHLTTTAYGGAKIDTVAIAKSLKGLRYGDAVDTAGKQPGVSRADVSLSPFWITKVPQRTGNIKISIKVAGVSGH